MFQAPIAIVGKLRPAWLSLPTPAWRTFAHICLDLAGERAHPYWAARPFSATTLRALWPGPLATTPAPTDRLRSLRGAVEAELNARLSRTLPDVGDGPPSHSHAMKTDKYGGCATCATFLSTNDTMPFDAWRRVNKVLNSSDVNGVLTETPVLIEDLIAQGETLASIRSSVYRALRDRTAFGDYATPWRAEDLFVPRSHIPTRVSLYRQILHARPSSFPLSAGMDAVDGVSLHVSGPEVCLELPDVSADA